MRCVLFALAAHAAAALDLMSAVLKSPIYKNLLVPASRNMMINTAKENGVPWADAVAWIRGATTWELDDDADVAVPAYSRQPFHAYEPGNLCWEAAWEAEVAGRAVGAERGVVSRTHSPSCNFRLPSRLPAEVARLVRVERLAVVRGHGHVGVTCVQLPRRGTPDPGHGVGPGHAVLLRRVYHHVARGGHQQILVDR